MTFCEKMAGHLIDRYIIENMRKVAGARDLLKDTNLRLTDLWGSDIGAELSLRLDEASRTTVPVCKVFFAILLICHHVD